MLLPTRIPTSPSNPANQPTEAEDRPTIDRPSDLATSDTDLPQPMAPIASNPGIRIRTYSKANPDHVRTGLLGFFSVTYHGLVLDSIALRRTTDNRLVLSFPTRVNKAGRSFTYFRPENDRVRAEIEHELLGQIPE
jgi:hypothetical protein